MRRCQIQRCTGAQHKERRVRCLLRENGQAMSHHDRDAEIAAFIQAKGVTRCPTACVVPTQGSPDLADQAALQQYASTRDQLVRTKIATRWQVFGSLRLRK